MANNPYPQPGSLEWRMSGLRYNLLEWSSSERRWLVVGYISPGLVDAPDLRYSLYGPGGCFSQKFPKGINSIDKAKTYVETLYRMTQ